MHHPFRTVWRRTSAMLLLLLLVGSAFSQQVDIPRVETMPNMPSPYLMRDWKTVAAGYDSLVFDPTRSGTYLPLIAIDQSTLNYPDEPGFGLASYVGQTPGGSGEAINVIPAVVGATLSGIDKSNQNGVNWVRKCREFFNLANGTLLYLNHPSAGTGGDWWYETMPNVFFFQLYDLYPTTEGFSTQLADVADRLLEEVHALGGRTVPWTKPNFNYTAFNFATMSPVTRDWKQPEAGGAIAWLLYHAYVQTGDERYRVGAELSMDFLQDWTQNPSYEIQMPYGVYAAARMNAELGTAYNVEKMVNWVFNESDVRNWGVISDRWGNYDVYGLVGEVNPDDYGFVMNGYETASALVPMVRYDDRFARAIGKWTLNLANASRLYYTAFLPDENQDSESWSHQYDLSSVMAHESMRKYKLDDASISPFATGDASGWGVPTNFALYGSSHVGYLGGIVDTTDVAGILRLNTRATDFFQNNAYPTYLYYNPYLTSEDVTVVIDSGTVDLWDAVLNAWVANGVSGSTVVTMPADQAMLLVQVPSGAAASTEYGVLYADGIPVDYTSGVDPGNRPPRIRALATVSDLVVIQSSVDLYCKAMDLDGDVISYTWSAETGSFAGSGANVAWTAPSDPDTVTVTCVVSDGSEEADTATVTLHVVNNRAPTIAGFEIDPTGLFPGDHATITCLASDPDGQQLSFDWSGPGFFAPNGNKTYWISPSTAGVYTIHCTATDPLGLMASDSTEVLVGDLVLHLAFSGNCDDSSPFGNDGTLNQGSYVEDRHGNANSALYLNGASTNRVTIPNSTSLNFGDAITLVFWMIPDKFPLSGREYYVVSHGSWENRWKISIIPDGKLRWTVKTDEGVKDLDSEVEMTKTLWLVAATYGDGQMQLYLNGGLDASTTHSGTMPSVGIDLLVGQKDPSETGYNYPGVIDEVRIYDRVLSDAEILALMDVDGVPGRISSTLPDRFAIASAYPNPFNDRMTMVIALPGDAVVRLALYNMLGQRVREIAHFPMAAGYRAFSLDAEGLASGMYLVRLSSPRYGSMTKRIVLLR